MYNLILSSNILKFTNVGNRERKTLTFNDGEEASKRTQFMQHLETSQKPLSAIEMLTAMLVSGNNLK